MTTYWLSYRIANHDAAAVTYAMRLEEFIEAIGGVADPLRVWSDTNSMHVFDSDLDINHVARWVRAPLLANYDLFLLKEMDSGSAVLFGASNDRAIMTLMPYIQKIN